MIPPPVSAPRKPSRRFALALAALVLGSAPAAAQEPYPTQFATDGVVYVAHEVSGVLHLGGQFERVGRAVGPGVPTNAATGAIPAQFPRVSRPGGGGTVRAVVADGAGGFFIGGDFDAIGGVPRRNLAHLDASLAVTAWSPDPDQAVLAMDLEGGLLYVGGGFTEIGGADRTGLAALDATTGTATAWNPAPDAAVLALVATPGTVYVGGQFANIGGSARGHLAGVSTATGAATALEVGLAGGFAVWELALGATALYFAGDFTTADGAGRNGLAGVEAATGNLLAWDPDPDAAVFALGYDGSRVIAGGTFGGIGTQTRPFLAALNLTNGRATSWAPEVNGVVRTLLLDGGVVHIGGSFSVVEGEPRTLAATLDAGNGAPGAWAPPLGLDPGNISMGEEVWALARSGTTLYAGGTLRACEPVARTNLAAIDLASGAVTSWNPGANSIVRKMAGRANTPLFVAGSFAQVGGQARGGLAALDRASGLATAWNPSPSQPVGALALEGTTLYVGGSFVSIAGQPRSRLASFDAISGALTPWNPLPNSHVTCILPAGSTVFIGGLFGLVAGQSRDVVAALDAATGAPLAWDPAGPSGGFDWNTKTMIFPQATALALDGNTLYVAGRFTGIGGQSVSNLAALDATTGVAQAWAPGGTGGANFGTSTVVWDLLLRPGQVIVGGEFVTMGGTSRANLAAVDRTTGAATAWAPNPDSDVLGLVDLGPTGFAAWGPFEDVQSAPLRHIGLFTHPAGPVKVVPWRASRLALATPAPHPLAARAAVRFTLARPGAVTLEVVDVAGRVRRTLLAAAPHPAGTSSVALERSGLPAGVYLLRLSMDGESTAAKLVVAP